MRRRIIAVIALIPALLFGCAGPTTNTTAQTGNTSSQEVAQEDSTQNSVTLTALQRSDGWNYGGSGSDGFYYVSSSVRDDGSANLMYLDYATMERIYLCNQPNCNHDTEACTSYLPYSAGGILPCVIGQNLVLVFPGNVHASADTSSTVMPHLEVMGLDGSNRKTTFTFESNQQINRPLVTDGTNIYCELDTATEDGQLKAELVRVNPVTGTKDTLCALNQEWIKGSAGSTIILLNANGCYSSYDPVSGDRKDIVTVDNASVDSMLQGTTLAYKDNGFFCLMDLLSGEKTSLSGFAVPSPEEAFVNLVDADSTHLLIKIETASHQSGSSMEDGYYMITGSSTPQQWTLLYSSGDQDTLFERVTTISSNEYLVISGEETLPDTTANSHYVATGEKQYVIMSQEDYWNSIAPTASSTQ
ncbi:MAG: hypothetical protein ACLTSY_11810 [Subdoligranulum sp.]